MLKKLLAFSLLSAALTAQESPDLYEQVKPLSPEETLKTIQVKENY